MGSVAYVKDSCLRIIRSRLAQPLCGVLSVGTTWSGHTPAELSHDPIHSALLRRMGRSNHKEWSTCLWETGSICLDRG